MTALLWLVGLLPLGAVIVVAGLRRPLWLLAAYAFVVPFGSATSLPLPLPPAFGSISTLVGLAAAAAIGIHVVVSRDRAAWLPATVGVWLLFSAVALASVIGSVNRSATVSDLLVLASLVGLYVVAGLTAPRRDELDLLERAIILGGALVGLHALQLLVTGDLPTFSGIPRFEVPAGGGTNGDPNITGASLLLPLFIAVGRGIRTRGAEQGLTLLAAALTLTGVLLTVSRGALVATLGGLVVIVAAGLGRRAVGWVLAPTLLALLVFSTAPGPLRDHLRKPTSSGRTEVWAIGLQACEQHCLLGSGWSTFPDVHEEILLRTPWASGTRLRFVAHNIWLQAAVELGLVGLLLLLGAFVVASLELRGVPPALRAPPLAALLSLALTNTFLSNLDFKYFWLVFIHAMMVTKLHGQPPAGRWATAVAAAGRPGPRSPRVLVEADRRRSG